MYPTAGYEINDKRGNKMAGYNNSVNARAEELARNCRELRLTFEGMQDYFRSHGYGAYLAQFQQLSDPGKWHGFLYKKNKGGE